jgi:acetyl-CoA acetyltransferase
MKRSRPLLATVAAASFAVAALAHHGWSSFDETKVIYLEGTVKTSKWQNPHAELVLETSGAAPPATLASAQVPAQSTAVNAASVLGSAKAPGRKDKAWTIELAPLTRMNAWNVAEIKAGEKLAVVGYTLKDEKSAPTLRVEYLVRDGKVTPLRSSPM